MKMDIEGSEYPVLARLLLDYSRTLASLKVLVIEWHERMLTRGAQLPRGTTAALVSMLQGHPYNVLMPTRWS